MSFIFIRHDDLSKVYNRVVLILYTRLMRETLCQYLGELELLSEDRQEIFFKIDVDIEIPPKHLKADEW